MSDTLTNITRKIGDFVAEQFKDADNGLFDDISDVVITDFIDKIKNDNPVLGSWVEAWKNKNTNNKRNNQSSCSIDTGFCGMTTRRSYSSGGCGTTTSYYGGC